MHFVFSVCLHGMFVCVHSLVQSQWIMRVFVSILRMTVSICLVCKSLSPSSDKYKQLHLPLSCVPHYRIIVFGQ